jgi:hypothetical protein
MEFLSKEEQKNLPSSLKRRRGEKDGILEVRRNKKTSPPYFKEEGEKDGIP